MIDPSAVRAQRSAAGGKGGGKNNQTIESSRGGRTTKIRALTDENCPPLAFPITAGPVADGPAAASPLDRLPDSDVVSGDKGYGSDARRKPV